MAAKSSVLQHFYKKNQEQRFRDLADFSNLTDEDLKLLKSDSALVRRHYRVFLELLMHGDAAVRPCKPHD
jgi:hypothetical protein